MAGLRNSGVDTSAWYLAGFSGTELPGAYDPEVLFGGTLPNFGLLDIDFRNPGQNVTMTYQELLEETWSPPVHYFDRGDGVLIPVDAGGTLPGAVVEFPAYTAAGVREGLYSIGEHAVAGIIRLPLDSASWTSTGVVDVHVGGEAYSAVPGTWTGYTNLTCSAGGTAHQVANTGGGTLAANQATGMQIVARRLSGTAQLVISVGDNTGTGRLRALYNFDTDTVTTQIAGTGVVHSTRKSILADGSVFLQLYGRFTGGLADVTARVGFADASGNVSFSAVGNEIMDVDWFGLHQAGNSSPHPIITIGTFGDGGLTPFTGVTFTNPPVVVAGVDGFTVLADLDAPLFLQAGSSTLRPTIARFFATGNHVARIGYRASDGQMHAEFFNNSVSQCQFTWTPTPGARQKVAFRVAPNDCSLHVNGVLIGTDTSATLPASMSFVSGGQNSIDSDQPLLKHYRATLAQLVDQATALVYSNSGW